MSILLRPNIAKVERQASAGVSKTGTPIAAAPTVVYAALPCFIEATIRPAMLDVAQGSQPVILELVVMYADGINVSGYTAGERVTWRGISLLVNANARSAFPDIQSNDRITDEMGIEYRVMSVQAYGDVKPSLQMHLTRGKAW